MSNYAKLCQEWSEKFLQMNAKELMEKLPELKDEGDYLTLYLFARKLGIQKETGEIEAMEDDRLVSNNTKLNVYTLFGYCKEYAALTGRWVPFRDLRGASPFAPAFQKGILEPLAATFAGHAEELEQACIQLGGTKLEHGDVGYELKSFDCMPVRIFFWDEDEEFSAQANILFDYSATDFIHVESTVSIAMEALYRLAEVAGLELKGSTFGMDG